jgi:hypothetical protein
MSWNPWNTPLDAGLIEGMLTPGLLKLGEPDSPREWDQRRGYGWAGSFPFFLGVKLSEFDAVFELYTDEHWDQWQAIRPKFIKPPAGKRPKALDFVHPILADLDIKSVVVTNVKGPKVDGDGVNRITISLLAFRVPKIALSKPEAAADKPSDDPIDREIAARAGRVQANALAFSE